MVPWLKMFSCWQYYRRNKVNKQNPVNQIGMVSNIGWLRMHEMLVVLTLEHGVSIYCCLCAWPSCDFSVAFWPIARSWWWNITSPFLQDTKKTPGCVNSRGNGGTEAASKNYIVESCHNGQSHPCSFILNLCYTITQGLKYIW